MRTDQQVARALIGKLTPWGPRNFTEEEWAAYFQCVNYIRQLNEEDVAKLLEEIQHEFTSKPDGDELQSKLFILLRLLFDIPETGDVSARMSFKGWENWPSPNKFGQVNLTWPIAWEGNQPFLESHYEGSLGKPYALTSEYSYFKGLYLYRDITIR